MNEFDKVIPSAIQDDVLAGVARESLWCFTDIRAEQTGYGYLVSTLDDNFREEDESAWDDLEPKAIGEVFAFDRRGTLVMFNEWRSASNERAIAKAMDAAGTTLLRMILDTRADLYAGHAAYGAITLDEDEFEAAFQPRLNRLNQNASFNGWMYETFGKEFEAVRAVAKRSPGRVWTLVDSGGITLISGMHFVNRLGYVLTRRPAKKGIGFEVSFE